LFYKIDTENGYVSIEKNVIGKIIIEEVKKFDGKIVISNHKGKVPGIVSKIGGLDDISHLEIFMGSKGLDVRVYIVIKFGASIGRLTNQLIDGIQDKIKELTAIEANSVAVIVTGIISKQFAKRNIEVKR
jgi:uncharacterized alkaline shock family protein YloU